VWCRWCAGSGESGCRPVPLQRVGSEQGVGAAVGEEDGAATEGGGGAEEEGDRRGDLVGGAEAAERDREAADRGAEGRVVEAALQGRRQRRAGGRGGQGEALARPGGTRRPAPGP